MAWRWSKLQVNFGHLSFVPDIEISPDYASDLCLFLSFALVIGLSHGYGLSLN